MNLRLGYNVIKDNGLKERIVDDPVFVSINGVMATGEQLQTASEVKSEERKEKHVLNVVPDLATMKKFANERANQLNYPGYEGYINAFLQPFCLPGYSANIVDARYPERNGLYLIESTEVSFGVNGARRKIGIGPKIS